MTKQNDLTQITKTLKSTLKNEIMFWQRKALKASKEGNTSACADALKKQGEAINTLLKIIG